MLNASTTASPDKKKPPRFETIFNITKARANLNGKNKPDIEFDQQFESFSKNSNFTVLESAALTGVPVKFTQQYRKNFTDITSMLSSGLPYYQQKACEKGEKIVNSSRYSSFFAKCLNELSKLPYLQLSGISRYLSYMESYFSKMVVTSLTEQDRNCLDKEFVNQLMYTVLTCDSYPLPNKVREKVMHIIKSGEIATWDNQLTPSLRNQLGGTPIVEKALKEMREAIVKTCDIERTKRISNKSADKFLKPLADKSIYLSGIGAFPSKDFPNVRDSNSTSAEKFVDLSVADRKLVAGLFWELYFKEVDRESIANSTENWQKWNENLQIGGCLGKNIGAFFTYVAFTKKIEKLLKNPVLSLPSTEQAHNSVFEFRANHSANALACPFNNTSKHPISHNITEKGLGNIGNTSLSIYSFNGSATIDQFDHLNLSAQIFPEFNHNSSDIEGSITAQQVQSYKAPSPGTNSIVPVIFFAVIGFIGLGWIFNMVSKIKSKKEREDNQQLDETLELKEHKSETNIDEGLNPSIENLQITPTLHNSLTR